MVASISCMGISNLTEPIFGANDSKLYASWVTIPPIFTSDRECPPMENCTNACSSSFSDSTNLENNSITYCGSNNFEIR